MTAIKLTAFILAAFYATAAFSKKPKYSSRFELLTDVADDIPTYLREDGRKTFVLGDQHGDVDAVIAILRYIGAIDLNGDTAAGIRIVFIGDESNKGYSTLKMRNLFLNLQESAAKVGSEVIANVGNHEARQLFGDIRHMMKPNAIASDRNIFIESFTEDEKNPATALEAVLKANFDPTSPYYAFMMRRNIFHIVGKVMIVHGGLGSYMMDLSPEAINSTWRFMVAALAREYRISVRGKPRSDPQRFVGFKNKVKELLNGPAGWLVYDDESPLNHSGLHFETVPADDLKEWMKKLGVEKIVVGHKPTLNPITKGKPVDEIIPHGHRTTYNGLVYRIDTNISKDITKDGPGILSALLIQHGELHSIQNIPRPSGEHRLRSKLADSPPPHLCANMPFLLPFELK